MTLTADWQFDLDGYLFGPGTGVTVVEFEPGDLGIRAQDQLSAFGDHRIFGVDRWSASPWTFELAIRERTADDAIGVLASLRSAWDVAARSTPQAVVPLGYRLAGRDRVLFGRPRQFTPVLKDLVFGQIPVLADFQPAHLGSFDATEQGSSLTLGASELGGDGVAFPVTFSFLWGGTVASPRHTTINVGGARDTHLTATITAGVEFVTDPYVIVSGQTVQLEGTLGPSQQAVVRGTPWDAGVFQADGTASSLTLSAGSRLADLTVAPGQHEVSFGGIDGSGTATCDVSWRHAHHSI